MKIFLPDFLAEDRSSPRSTQKYFYQPQLHKALEPVLFKVRNILKKPNSYYKISIQQKTHRSKSSFDSQYLHPDSNKDQCIFLYNPKKNNNKNRKQLSFSDYAQKSTNQKLINLKVLKRNYSVNKDQIGNRTLHKNPFLTTNAINFKSRGYQNKADLVKVPISITPTNSQNNKIRFRETSKLVKVETILGKEENLTCRPWSSGKGQGQDLW